MIDRDTCDLINREFHSEALRQGLICKRIGYIRCDETTKTIYLVDWTITVPVVVNDAEAHSVVKECLNKAYHTCGVEI